MTEDGGDVQRLRGRIYELLDGIAERLSLSFAIYAADSDWPALYRDASHDSLCGFARRASPTSGRCRDEEAEMARTAIATGREQGGHCWQGTRRRVLPVALRGTPVLAVALCGMGIDPAAAAADYLPAEIAAALGLGAAPGPGAARIRTAAFPADSALPAAAADVIADLVRVAVAALAAQVAAGT